MLEKKRKVNNNDNWIAVVVIAVDKCLIKLNWSGSILLDLKQVRKIQFVDYYFYYKPNSQDMAFIVLDQLQ